MVASPREVHHDSSIEGPGVIINEGQFGYYGTHIGRHGHGSIHIGGYVHGGTHIG